MSLLTIKEIVLITGASSGIGKSCAEYLTREGYQVYGTSRHPDVSDRPYTLIPMDVNEDDSVANAIQQILEQEGRLDVVINNAGFGLAGAVEDTSTEEMKQQFETNYFGLFRVCRAVLPVMRNQQSGRIINISSLSGLISVPFQAAYSASKYAVEGLTEALSMEVKADGIVVVLIEPGDFHTGFTDNRRWTEASRSNSNYTQRCQQALQVMEADELKGAGAEQIAHLIHKIIKHPAPRLRYTIGPGVERLAVQLKKVLPSRLFEWLMMQNYKISP